MWELLLSNLWSTWGGDFCEGCSQTNCFPLLQSRWLLLASRHSESCTFDSESCSILLLWCRNFIIPTAKIWHEISHPVLNCLYILCFLERLSASARERCVRLPNHKKLPADVTTWQREKRSQLGLQWFSQHLLAGKMLGAVTSFQFDSSSSSYSGGLPHFSHLHATYISTSLFVSFTILIYFLLSCHDLSAALLFASWVQRVWEVNVSYHCN